jgi:hypothetical protein
LGRGPRRRRPHAPYLQSERGPHYEAALARLRGAGALAEDWLSRRDLQLAASAPHDGGGPLYGPAERRLSDALAPQRRAEGRAPAWRARFPAAVVEVDDRLHGVRTFDVARDVGDVVVRRSDGLWAYALAVVVDDAAMGVTEVVRGDDLLAATGAQAALAAVLGLPSLATPTLRSSSMPAARASPSAAATPHWPPSGRAAPTRAGWWGRSRRPSVGSPRRRRSPRASCWRAWTRPAGPPQPPAGAPNSTRGSARPEAPLAAGRRVR